MARNRNLKDQVESTLHRETMSGFPGVSPQLARSKMQLQEAKENFLRELNRRDPGWAEKMRQRKIDDIQKLENAKSLLTQEIEQRERQLVDDKFQDARLARLKSEFMNE